MAKVTPIVPAAVAMKQFATRIPADIHQAMKVHCAQTGEKMEEYAARCLRDGLAAQATKKVAKK